MSDNPGEHTTPSFDNELAEEALRLANSMAFPVALKSALELGVIDTIYANGNGQFLSTGEIISKLPRKPSNPNASELLDRVLRALASYSILRCRVDPNGENHGGAERLYGAGPICSFLVMKNQGSVSVGPLHLATQGKVFMESWYHLTDAIMEGGIPFERAHGMSIFEYAETDHEFNKIYNEGVSNHTKVVMSKLLKIYEGFEGLATLVDIAGGIGTTASMITKKYPNIKAINFDLPHVIAGAPSYPGVEHVGGDMFVGVPKGDAIFMKCILHDWSEEHCLRILKNCWQVLPNHGKLIVVDLVLGMEPGNDVCSKMAADMDLLLLSLYKGGRERTLREFEELAVKSGFLGCQLICSVYKYGILEFHK